MFETTLSLDLPVREMDTGEEPVLIVEEPVEEAAEPQEITVVEEDFMEEFEPEDLTVPVVPLETLEAIRTNLENMREIIQSHLAQELKLLKEFTERLPEFALKIARKVIATEIDQDPSVIHRTLERALQSVSKTKQVTVFLNPQDYEYLSEHLDEVDSGDSVIKLEARETIDRGGCLLKTDFEEVDARIESQIQHIEEMILQSLTGKVDAR